MPGGYRVAILALGLLASVAWGQGREPAGTFIEGQPIPAARQSEASSVDDDGDPGDSPGADQGAADPVPLALRADDLISVLDRIETALRGLGTPIEDEAQFHERELRAREEIAYWAMATFWAALGVGGLTAIAVFAIFRNLHHARRAAGNIIGEARETTRAALAAAEQASRAHNLAEKAFSGLGRPYVIPIVVDHNLPKYVTAKGSADQELSASIIYKNSGSSAAVLKMIAPIASTIPATSEPEPLNPFYFNRDLFLELEASYLEPGQATKEISISCSLPKRVRELAAARGVSFSSLTGDAAKVVLQDRLTYTDLLGNETILYVRYDYVLGFFELIQIREEGAGSRENAERVEHERAGDAAT